MRSEGKRTWSFGDETFGDETFGDEAFVDRIQKENMKNSLGSKWGVPFEFQMMVDLSCHSQLFQCHKMIRAFRSTVALPPASMRLDSGGFSKGEVLVSKCRHTGQIGFMGTSLCRLAARQPLQ